MVKVYRVQSQVELTFEEDGGSMIYLMVLQALQTTHLKMTEEH